MKKQYKSSPVEQKLEKTVKKLNGRMKWKRKNAEFEKIEFPVSYQYEGLDITIVSADENEKDLLEVFLVVKKDGVRVKVPQPFLYQNPPIKVPNGTFRKEMIMDKEQDVENTEVNVTEALKQFVGHTVKLQANK